MIKILIIRSTNEDVGKIISEHPDIMTNKYS